MPKNPKVAGQIISADGERVFLVGETLEGVLDLANWELVVDTFASAAGPLAGEAFVLMLRR